jgi:hypothetical protein
MILSVLEQIGVKAVIKNNLRTSSFDGARMYSLCSVVTI